MHHTANGRRGTGSAHATPSLSGLKASSHHLFAPTFIVAFMAPASCLNPHTLPDSRYAVELRRDAAALRFGAALEPEYVRTRLVEMRTIVRAACVLAILLALLRTVDLFAATPGDIEVPISLAIVIAGSLVLVALAWSPLFEQWYLPAAQFVVPVRNAIVAANIAAATAHGHQELLMALPLIVLGPFFFLGLQYRAALYCCVLTVSAFVACNVLFEVPLPVALRSCIFLIAAAVACAIAARNFEKRSRRSFLESRLIAELAEHDPLTGAKNRRVFDERLGALWQQAIRDQHTLSILLLDVDHFKAFNDRYGHQAGDQVLRRIARTLQTFVRRPHDVLARYGGEEFAVILYDFDLLQTRELADKMRSAVHELDIEHRGSPMFRSVTASVGVAVVAPTPKRDPRGALQLADQALYDAKRGGRNRIEVRDDDQHELLVTGVFEKQAFVRR